jgi:hypothetical protein
MHLLDIKDLTWVEYSMARSAWLLHANRARLESNIGQAQVELANYLFLADEVINIDFSYPSLAHGVVDVGFSDGRSQGSVIGISCLGQLSPTYSVDVNCSQSYELEPASRGVPIELWEKRQHCFVVDAIHTNRLRETIRSLRFSLRLVNLLIRLSLRALGFHRPYSLQLSHSEKSWCLLHGAHPPRHDAGVSLPALATAGRAFCLQVP